ncbi:MAG TPA: YCF48-related protein [Steroidobacteraceae bacterium]
MVRSRGRALLWLAALALVQSARAAELAPLPAEPARLAAQSLLIAVAAAGPRLIAVGDRGVIVLSDDKGRSWVQAAEVPTQALLTGVCFLDAQHGVAVGHDEVILVSADAGRTWKRTHYAPEAQRPLLDVWCGAGGQAIAVGAYSTYLASADGGTSWSERKFTAAAPRARPAVAARAAPTAPAADEGAAGGGYHLNRIVSAGGSRLYIAGESGHLYRSDDNGAHWLTLTSPYEGSFFGALPVAGEALLAFGLRGHLYRSEDAGGSWRKIDTGTVAMLDGAVRLGEAGVAIVGFAGVVLVSHDGGGTFTLVQQSDRAGLSAAVIVGDDELAAVGEDGAKVIDLRNAPAAAHAAR